MEQHYAVGLTEIDVSKVKIALAHGGPSFCAVLDAAQYDRKIVSHINSHHLCYSLSFLVLTDRDFHMMLKPREGLCAVSDALASAGTVCESRRTSWRNPPFS